MHTPYTPSFTMDYDEDNHLVKVEIGGLITREDNLALLEEISHQIRLKDAERLLIDARQSKTTPSETIKWVSEYYINVLSEQLPSDHRQLKVARIESKETCQHLQNTVIDKVRQAFAAPLQIGFFRDVTSAQQWLIN